MHVDDATLILLVKGHHRVFFLFRRPSVVVSGHGIDRELLQITGRNEVVERLRGFLLVERVLRDDGPQGEKILFQHRLARPDNRLVVGRQRDRHENENNADDDHQLNQRKPAVSSFGSLSHYHVLYSVPSKPVPWDFVNTSNTFWPPQESESGSSCIDRNPHSVVPVMGSTGMRRRNFNFLPCTSTPFTRVSRSGGYPSVPTLV